MATSKYIFSKKKRRKRQEKRVYSSNTCYYCYLFVNLTFQLKVWCNYFFSLLRPRYNVQLSTKKYTKILIKDTFTQIRCKMAITGCMFSKKKQR